MTLPTDAGPPLPPAVKRLNEAERLLRAVSDRIRWDAPAPEHPDATWDLCQDIRRFLDRAAPVRLPTNICNHHWNDVTTVADHHRLQKVVCSVCGETKELPTTLYPGEVAAIGHPAGHQWATDPDDGMVDFFALNVDSPDGFSGHNGPRCTRCGFAYCVHCHQDGPPAPCGDATPTTEPR